MIMVIVMNLFKCVTLCYQEDPMLVTVGDALTRFFGNLDELTLGRCLNYG